MQIIRLGHSCFRIQNDGTTLIIDPFEDSIGLKMPKVSADIVLSSHDHYDHANFNAIRGESFKISTPGEYEVKDVFIYAIKSYHDDNHGQDRGENLIFFIEIEGMKLVHLGDFGQKELTQEQLKKLEGVDILMIPVGGTFTIDAKKAAEIISILEPAMVIPMHYKELGVKLNIDPLEKFKKEIGNKMEIIDKLKIKKKDLPKEETKVVVLTPQK